MQKKYQRKMKIYENKYVYKTFNFYLVKYKNIR